MGAFAIVRMRRAVDVTTYPNMQHDRKIKIEILNEGSRMEFVFSRDAPIDEIVTILRTLMTYMSWHPDIVESLFNHEFLEDHGI
jgi:hypothetical protein